jgi:hypothetical protein
MIIAKATVDPKYQIATATSLTCRGRGEIASLGFAAVFARLDQGQRGFTGRLTSDDPLRHCAVRPKGLIWISI